MAFTRTMMKERGTSKSSSLSPVPDSPASQPQIKTRAYVLLPTLPPTSKEKYKPAQELGLNDEMEVDFDEIIGEYREGRQLYYYARYQEGIAHKITEQVISRKHPGLIEKYNEAKAAGKYGDFDPSAHYVHPLSRVKMRITISQDRKASVSISSAKSVQSDDDGVVYVPDSEEEAEMLMAGDGDSFAGTPEPTKRTIRSKQSQLPFSPRKTRSQQVAVLESESEADSSRPSRRPRRKAAIKINLDSEYEDQEDYDDDLDSAYGASISKAKGKKPLVRKVPIPSYGHIHSVKDIKGDPYPDDPENVALRNHRSICEKCHQKPAHLLLENVQKRKGKKRKRASEDEFEMSDGEKFASLGGWVRCLKCPVSVHWQCLAATQQSEILKAAREKDRLDWLSKGGGEDPVGRRSFLETDETTDFVCAACVRGGPCIGCMEVVAHHVNLEVRKDASGDVEMGEPTALEESTSQLQLERKLIFRCFTCKRAAHYDHLPLPKSFDSDSHITDIAEYYQGKGFLCADCVSFRYPLDKILAWRPYPANAVETESPPNYRNPLPREYLVKWADRSYRRLSWVPHMWLLSTHQGKLKNFLSGGAKVELLTEIPIDDEAMDTTQNFEIGAYASKASSDKGNDMTTYGPLDALPDAEKRIPPRWKTVDRVLDLIFWDDESKAPPKKNKSRIGKKAHVVESDEDELMDEDKSEPEELKDIFDTGELPENLPQMNASEWEQVHDEIKESDISKVVWAFIKWDDLGYEEASWDAPPRPGEPGYDAFVNSFRRFIHSRTVFVRKLKPAEEKKFEDRPSGGFGKHRLRDPGGLELGQDPSLKLLNFQVEGFNWLCDNWWEHQACILADDMGLGKTVQVSTFIGTIATKWQAYPVLVVVPNSTITNWVREFERWAPKLRVVPFYGERKARDIIKQFELFHDKAPEGHTNAKFHVLVTTYEGITGTSDWAAVFKKQPRWECLVVDEGQRLKSDSSLLFRKLNELKSAHRVIMTGTPLNNNMRELFNLMNFLDPVEWRDLEDLEKQYTELSEELVKELHNRLRPYFLRRIKSEVLDLPPKNEVIVPLSMAPMQKQVYRSILSHNADLLKGLTTANKPGNVRGKLNNVLMHMRKCLQHPYLYNEDIEPKGLSPAETHGKLIDGSTKLRFLKMLLPKLKARGHRVLLFSQFVIALDVIEDFLAGEGYKFLRLDGNTKGTTRQKSMDEFNKPNSEYFIFLLTTRAGGVGINLFTADTVIIFDPDFNPHQDLQAIARSYRYGQKKTCMVFKLMVKESAEERIMQIGKKKLVLDHLIVQKMDEDDDSPGENIQSILTYGAQALFNEESSVKDIVYSDQDIDKLIEKTETESDESDKPKEGGLSFEFAKVWATDRNDLDEIADDDQVDSWAQTLQKINEEKAKVMAQEQTTSGRGARRKAATAAKSKLTVHDSTAANDSPAKRGRASPAASDFDFQDRESISSDSESHISVESDEQDLDFAAPVDKGKKKQQQQKPRLHPSTVRVEDTHSDEVLDCGLCGGKHGIKKCLMTDNSMNLAEYRQMLILHADDEPWEERYAAVMAIDELLQARGDLRLIHGQPLHPLPKATSIPPTKKPKQAAEGAQEYLKKQAASTRPKATIADYNGTGKEAEVVRSFVSKAGNNALAGPSRAPAPVAGPSNVQPTTATSICILCRTPANHKVKNCTAVKNKPPAHISHLIGLLEANDKDKHADLIKRLRRVLGKL